MPRRNRITLLEVADRENLTRAAWQAARGKRQRRSIQQFLAALDENLNRLADEVLSGEFAPAPYRSFSIHDPKPRIIHAPAFRDRVLHHAIINVSGSQLDRTLIDDSFACRTGKGPIAAVKRAQHFTQRFDWYAKVDIQQYFHSVDHELLLERLARRIKGDEFLELLTRIVHSFETSHGRGLPIGALTSQYFANLYLNDADRWLQPSVRGLVRYMDDSVCWFDDRMAARDITRSYRQFLSEHLHLTLNSDLQIHRSREGLSFCGHRIYPGIVKLTRRRQRLYVRACRRWEHLYLNGHVSAQQLQSGYASAFSLTKHANAVEWRRQRLPQHLVDEI